MAWYSSESVRFRGRLVEVTFRYGHYHGAEVVQGKPLCFAPDYFRGYRFRNKEERSNTRGILRVLRRKGLVDEGGSLTYDAFAGIDV